MSYPLSSPDQLNRSAAPRSTLVWYHATEKAHIGIAAHLADRLAAERPGTRVLLTTSGHLPGPHPRPPVHWTELPADRPASTRSFIEDWAPDICIWSVGHLRPNLLNAAHRRQIPIYLVDADETQLDSSGWRWLPNAQKASFRHFETILTRTPEAETHIRRKLGIKSARLRVTGPIRPEIRPLPCNETDRDDLAAVLLGRSVWLAAHVDMREIPTILRTQRAVMRRSHRVLLVLSPQAGTDMDAAQSALKEAGLRHIRWSEGDMPDENTQVILADTPEELGLWYRLAPVSFMGGSLLVGHVGTDPLEPAAHGSAILYGPNVRDHLDTYSRLAEMGGARIVRDVETLTAAVQQIIPADKSAAMAHAAWDVATQSALVMDNLVDMLIDRLDRKRAGG